MTISKLVVGAATLSVAAAGITMDHGQFHHHKTEVIADELTAAEKLTVHVIPHSHDDIGWLKTIDEYFDGADRGTQWTNVEVEITTIMNALIDNPERKFSQVEIKFFTMWWDRQTDDMKKSVKTLVKNGQLEFINGGWSMHDEACPIYEDMIANHMVGMEFLHKEFGVHPRIGWQIDPFGHSNTNARFFAEMGFDAWFFARLDYQDKEKRLNEKEMQFVWRPAADSLGNDTQIFTHALDHHYSSPEGFNFDMVDDDDPWINEESSDTYNAPEEAQKLISDIDDRASHFKTNHMFLVFGDDFRYMNAHQNFRNMDNMISYMNANHGDKYVFRYSTPSEYVDAIAALNVTWPTKYDDMFPYSDLPNAYWTGYFTSRPNNKAYTRDTSRHMHAFNNLLTEQAFKEGADMDEALEKKHMIFDVIGSLQHHDAITGTGRQHVADDYSRRAAEAMFNTSSLFGGMISDKVTLLTGIEAQDWQQCEKTNATYVDCSPMAEPLADLSKVVVAVQNPSTLDFSTVKIPVADGHYEVRSFNETSQEFEEVDAEVHCFNDSLTNGTSLESCFLHAAHATPANDISVLLLTKNSKEDIRVEPSSLQIGAVLKNKDFTFEFVGWSTGGFLQFNMTDLVAGDSHILYLEMGYYESWKYFAEWSEDQQNSGDYIFRPADNQFHPYGYTNYTVDSSTWTNGTNFQQMDFYFENADLSDSSRRKAIIHVSLDADLPVVRVDFDLNSLPYNELTGFEVVAQFKVDNFNQSSTFWTDSNGMEMQERHLNYRPTWDLQANYNDSLQNVTANYFPINSAISMKDGDMQFTVMNDRPQAGSSLEAGKIEFMQNRRIIADDNRGMGEPLDENDEFGNGVRVPATYYFQLFNTSERASVQRLVQLKTDHPPQLFFSHDSKYSDGDLVASTLSSDLKKAGIVDTVQLITFPEASGEIVIRLENLADNYDSEGKTYTVDLQAIVDALVKSASRGLSCSFNSAATITELGLGANLSLEALEKRRVQWKTIDDQNDGPSLKARGMNGSEVKVVPQQIRVFSAKVAPICQAKFLQ